MLIFGKKHALARHDAILAEMRNATMRIDQFIKELKNEEEDTSAETRLQAVEVRSSKDSKVRG